MPQDFKDGTYEVVGAAYKVHAVLGQGLREKPYENALVIELRKTSNAVEQQKSFPIWYENTIVGECVADIVVDRSILIEVKAVEKLGEREIAQTLNYLRISGIETGLIINFFNNSVEVRRLVLPKGKGS